MKIIKGFAFFLMTMMVISCFNPPEYANVPEIGFDRVEFHRAADPSDPDTLSIFITFKDGNGDLGLDAGLGEHDSDPYHAVNYYHGSGGELVPITTSTVYAVSTVTNQRDTLTIMNIADASKGKLIVYRTRRNQPAYNSLPTLSSAGCDWEYAKEVKLLVEDVDAAVLEPGTEVVDTLTFFDNDKTRKFYQVLDTLYFTRNPNHFNIEVDFLVKDPLSTSPSHPGFREFDWGLPPYCTPFDGRFPILADNTNALDGTLRYDLISYGFIATFGNNTPIMLRIQIKDRALNLSRKIDTPTFTF